METLTHDFNSFVSTQLNSPQHQAVTTAHGALLVIAGAGSGKTRVITARIANLILNHNVLPSQIVALTFTNKAAGEMKERVERFIGSYNNRLDSFTFRKIKHITQQRTNLYLFQFFLIQTRFFGLVKWNS